MKTPVACLGVITGLALACSAVSAQYAPPCYPYAPYYPPRVAPDMCGGYFYTTDGCGWYPTYSVMPAFQPVTGVIPTVQSPPTPPNAGTPGMAGQLQPFNVALPYNPWTRSPRDYFMWSEAQKQLHTRETRPPF